MIGVVMLTGLVSKNAILLVDYTNTLRGRGYKRDTAILEAGPVRLRPILMTTTAMVLGMLPVALKIGRAAELRAPMAIVVIGGLVLSTLLGQVGLDAHMVENGEEAVAACDDAAWDLVLMDVQMPVMDGVTAVRAIRAREAAEGRPRVPVIALTANAMSHHRAEYLAAGMDAMVAKPIQLAQLLAAMDAALSGEELRQSA